MAQLRPRQRKDESRRAHPQRLMRCLGLHNVQTVWIRHQTPQPCGCRMVRHRPDRSVIRPEAGLDQEFASGHIGLVHVAVPQMRRGCDALGPIPFGLRGFHHLFNYGTVRPR